MAARPGTVPYRAPAAPGPEPLLPAGSWSATPVPAPPAPMPVPPAPAPGWEHRPSTLPGDPPWARLAMFGAGAAMLYAADDEVRDLVQAERSDATDRLADLARPMGDRLPPLAVLGGLYAYGAASGDPELQRDALRGMGGVALSQLAVETLKHLTHRVRPRDGEGARAWEGPSVDPAHRSFPSGHAATAFALATALSASAGDRPAVAVPAYAAATLTALSRVHDDKHWISDVFVGAALGTLLTRLMYAWDDTRDAADASPPAGRVVLGPMPDEPGAVGLGFELYY